MIDPRLVRLWRTERFESYVYLCRKIIDNKEFRSSRTVRLWRTMRGTKSHAPEARRLKLSFKIRHRATYP